MKLKDFQAVGKAREQEFVRAALVRNRWSCTATARDLGIVPSSLLTTIKRLGLTEEYHHHNPGRGRPK